MLGVDSGMRMRRRVLVVGFAAALLGMWVSPAGAHHVREGDVRFKVTCDYSHSNFDDPIVFPAQPGLAHRHDFFGNTTVDAFTDTYAEVNAGPTNCNDPGDKAGYWAPSLYANGNLVTPGTMTGYYRLGGKHPPIEPYPDGLKIIAGNGLPDGSHQGWKCGGTQQGNGFGQPPPASCPQNNLMATIEFPDCWDGVNTDSPDHRSHMAYSLDAPVANVCPPTHPVQVPELTVNIHYVTGARPITLSSGSQETLHSDLFQGWDAGRLAERVDTCLNGLQRCDSGG